MLNLFSNAIGARGALALARSEGLRALNVLNLFSNAIGDAGVEALERSETLQHCKVLA